MGDFVVVLLKMKFHSYYLGQGLTLELKEEQN